jgi:hypothetical protein
MNNFDKGIGQDIIGIGKVIEDSGKHATLWKINRWLSEEDFKNAAPYNTSEFDGNIFVNAGLNLLWTILCGGAGTAYSHANAYIAVGTNATGAVATDVALGTESARVAMDTSYPTYGTSQQAVFRSTFDSSTANVHWQEFGVFNAVSGVTMLNHKISDQGTKTAGQVWQVSCTITIS